MAKIYQLVQNFQGYVTKPDPTNTDERTLVSGSQNVLINDDEKVSTRKGYSIFGAANTARNAVESAFDWQTSGYQGSDLVHNLRSYDDELEVYLATIDGIAVNAWTRIADGWSAVDFEYAAVYDSTEAIDILVFVNGDANLYDWSGGVATIASATADTITKNGTKTWAESRFLTTGTRKVLINGTEYTYTGGESTTTLTGVTPDPSGEAADSVATQATRTNSNAPASGFNNDVIRVQNNQLWVGSTTDRLAYVSKDTDFTDFTFSTPRATGEGAKLTLDGSLRGFAPLEQEMVIFAGRDLIYRSEFAQLDVSGSIKETLKVKKIKTSTDMAAQSQALIAEIGNAIAFVSFEPNLRVVGSVAELEGPQLATYSNPIKPDFDGEDFSNGHLKFHRNRLYIATPTNSKLYILEFRESVDGQITRLWQPPQILPVRRLAIISDVIHGHSNGNPETYKLFDGTDDNGKSFFARAVFAYRNFGDRANFKNFNEYFIDGRISANTKLKVTLNYDFGGFTQQLERTIDGSNANILFASQPAGILGEDSLGDVSIGSEADDDSDELDKFQTILTFAKKDFVEFQTIYETDETDYQWSILSHGPNARRSVANRIKIKI